MSPGGKIGQCRSKCLSAHPSEVLPITVPSFLWGRIGFEETLSACRAQDLAGARRVLRALQNRQLFQRRSRGSLAGKLPWACGGLPETCPALTLGWVVSGFSSPEAQLGRIRGGPLCSEVPGRGPDSRRVWTRRGTQVPPRPSVEAHSLVLGRSFVTKKGRTSEQGGRLGGSERAEAATALQVPLSCLRGE